MKGKLLHFGQLAKVPDHLDPVVEIGAAGFVGKNVVTHPFFLEKYFPKGIGHGDLSFHKIGILGLPGLEDQIVLLKIDVVPSERCEGWL